MANKKSGSIAVPFLVTVFLGLLIIGGAAFGLYNYFGLGKGAGLKEPVPRQAVTTTYEDNHTVLFVLETPDMKCTSTFVLMRSIPKDKKIHLMGIPSNMIYLVDGEQQNLKSVYERGGASSAVTFLEQVLGVEIDKYMKFDSESFMKVCDVFGGVSYPVDADIAGFKNDGSVQYLNSSQIVTFVTYSLFEGGEVQRAYVASSLLSSMVNQADGKRIADNMDITFNTIINSIDSDITAVDYKKKKTAIKGMLENGGSIANFVTMEGTPADPDFIPSDDFIKDFRDTYFADKTVNKETETENAE